MTGVILVSNRERELSVLTAIKPLPLHRMGEKTLIAHQIAALFGAGARHVAVVSETDKGIQKEIFENENASRLSFFQSGKYGAEEFFFEFFENVLGKDYEAVVISEGLAVTAEDIMKLTESNRELFADVSVMMREVRDPKTPVFSISSLCRIEGVFVPPSVDYSYSDFTYGGAALISGKTLEKRKNRKVKSFELDFLPDAAASFSVYGHIADREIINIEALSDYKAAVKFYNEKSGGKGCIQIGENFKKGKGCEIRESVIFDNVTVGDGSKIFGSIILDDAEIGKNVTVKENSVIGTGAEIENGAVIEKNSVIPSFKAVSKEKNGKALSASEAYEAGKRLGSCAGKIMASVCGEGECEKALALFADGAVLSGADVFVLRNIPEAVWRFAANRYGCEGGAYFTENGTVLCGNLGADSFPDLSVKREKCGTGKKTELFGIKELYAEELLRFSEKGFTANISSENEMLSELYCQNVVNCTEDDYISFFVNERGNGFSLTDERGVYLSEEHTPTLAAFSALIVFEKLYIPKDYPLADRLLENATGGRIIRVFEEDRINMRKALRFLDASFCISMIAKAVKKTKKPLFELVTAVPKSVSRSVTVSLSQSRKALLRLYNTEAAAERGAVPSFFQTERGGIFIKENRNAPEITVTAVSVSEADCKELLKGF